MHLFAKIKFGLGFKMAFTDENKKPVYIAKESFFALLPRLRPPSFVCFSIRLPTYTRVKQKRTPCFYEVRFI